MPAGDLAAYNVYAGMLECFREIARRASQEFIFKDQGTLGTFASSQNAPAIVAIFELTDQVRETDIDAITHAFPASMLLLFHASPEGRSPAHDALLARGFTHHTMPIMCVKLDALKSDGKAVPGLRLAEVRSDADYSALVAVQLATFGPEYEFRARLKRSLGLRRDGQAHHLLGFLQDRAIAAATLLETGPIATLWGIATLEQYRGHGIGGAITRTTCEFARDRGHEAVGLWATALGEPVYERIGFAQVGLGATYVCPPGAAQRAGRRNDVLGIPTQADREV